MAQWLSTGISRGRPGFDITAGPPLEVSKLHVRLVRFSFFFYGFYGFFKGYKPEVPFHNSFESQLCGTLKNPHAIRKDKGTEFPVLWFVLHPTKKRHGVFFLSRRALVVLKV